MIRTIAFLIALLSGTARLDAAVFCARPRPDGTFATTVKIRELCKPPETAITPAVVGLQGPQGPVGPQGPTGPQGPQGEAGVCSCGPPTGTVVDQNTGLMWELKQSDNGSADYSNPHDADNTYTWSSSGTAPDGPAFTDFLFRLNTAPCFAGHCDWRLPTIGELQGLMDGARAGCGAPTYTVPCSFPFVDPTEAAADLIAYWSASQDPSFADRALSVFFGNDTTNSFFKSTGFHVRAVRNGP